MEEGVRGANVSAHLKKNLFTRMRRRRKREATTPTTHPRPPNTSSTPPRSEEAISQMNIRAQKLNLSWFQVLLHLRLLPHAKKCGRPNLTKYLPRTTITTTTAAKDETRNDGSATHSPATIMEEVKERSGAWTQSDSRAQRTN